MNAQRGQTMPFWLIAMAVIITLMAFLGSYVNTVAWHIRAQNAADSAASGALSIQANVLNEMSTLLYAAAVDEYRIRAVNQALINTMSGKTNCATNGTCNSDYQILLQEYNELVAQNGAFSMDIQLLRQADNFTQGGQQQDQRKAAQAFGNCSQPGNGLDCAFTFNIIDSVLSNPGKGKKSNVNAEVDILACRVVPYFAPALFLGGHSPAFQAVGRSAGALVPAVAPSSFSPGVAIDPYTGTVYEPQETGWNGLTLPNPTAPYIVDFTGLTVNLNWYATSLERPFGGQATYNPSYNNVGDENADGQFGCTTTS